MCSLITHVTLCYAAAVHVKMMRMNSVFLFSQSQTPTHHLCSTYTHSWISQVSRKVESRRPCFSAAVFMRPPASNEQDRRAEGKWVFVGGKSQRAALPSIQLLCRFQSEGVLAAGDRRGNARLSEIPEYIPHVQLF